MASNSSKKEKKSEKENRVEGRKEAREARSREAESGEKEIPGARPGSISSEGGPDGSEAENSASARPDLKVVVEESTSRLAEAEEIPTPRRRGRPPGSKTKSEPTASVAPAPVLEPEPPKPGPLYPMLKPLVKAPFNIAAAKTHFEGWKLDPEETDGLALQLDVCLAHYLPQLSQSESVWVATLMAFAGVAAGKGMAYGAWRAEKIAEAEAETKAAEAETGPREVRFPESSAAPVAAGDFFPRQNQ